MWDIFVLASCECHFIRVHENWCNIKVIKKKLLIVGLFNLEKKDSISQSTEQIASSEQKELESFAEEVSSGFS